MQNKWYTTQFSLPPLDWFTLSPQAVIVELQTHEFANFTELPKRNQLHE